MIAPTGSGKTLAAFLWAIDRLARESARPANQGTKVLYISPLKALAIDVERNLRTPLAGIARVAEHDGQPLRGSASGSARETPRPHNAANW